MLIVITLCLQLLLAAGDGKSPKFRLASKSILVQHGDAENGTHSAPVGAGGSGCELVPDSCSACTVTCGTGYQICLQRQAKETPEEAVTLGALETIDKANDRKALRSMERGAYAAYRQQQNKTLRAEKLKLQPAKVDCPQM